MNMTLIEQTLPKLVRRIVQVAHPRQVILFGSAARGEIGPHGDVDLLVVVNETASAPNSPDRGECAGKTFALMPSLANKIQANLKREGRHLVARVE